MRKWFYVLFVWGCVMAILLDATFATDTDGFSAGTRNAAEGYDFEAGFLQITTDDTSTRSISAVSSGVTRVDFWFRATDSEFGGAATKNTYIYLLPTSGGVSSTNSVQTIELARHTSPNGNFLDLAIRGASSFDEFYVTARQAWHKVSVVIRWADTAVDVYINDVLVLYDFGFANAAAADFSRIVLLGNTAGPTTDFDGIRVDDDWSLPTESVLVEDDFTVGSGAIEASTPDTDLTNATPQPWKSPDDTSSFGTFTRGAPGLTGSDTLRTAALVRTAPDGIWESEWTVTSTPGDDKYMGLVVRSWEGVPISDASLLFRYWEGSGSQVALVSNEVPFVAASATPAGVSIADGGTYTLKMEARGVYVWCYIVEDGGTEHLQFGGPVNLRTAGGNRGLLSQDYAGPVLDGSIGAVDSGNKPLSFKFTGRVNPLRIEKTIGEWTYVLHPASLDELYNSEVDLPDRNLLYDQGIQHGHIEEHDPAQQSMQQSVIYNTTNALVVRQRAPSMREDQTVSDTDIHWTITRSGVWVDDVIDKKSSAFSLPPDLDLRGELWDEDFRRIGNSGSSVADAEGGFHGSTTHATSSPPLGFQSLTDLGSGDEVRLSNLMRAVQNTAAAHRLVTWNRGQADPLTRKIRKDGDDGVGLYIWAHRLLLERGALSLSDSVLTGLRDDLASPSVSVTTGTLNTAVDGDLDTDGFNERFGWYEITADGSGGAAFTLATSTTRYYPVIRLAGATAGGTLTADASPLTEGTDYVADDLGDGRVLIQILSVVSTETDYVWASGAATTPPSTPTVTIDAVGEHSVNASTSAFVAGEGGSHTHTQWQITTAADTSFANPVYDPGDDATNLTSITGAGSLIADTDYLIHARHKEDDTTYSEWSTAVAFSTAFSTGIRYVPVAIGDTITVVGLFVMEGGSDATEAEVRLLWHRLDKTTITTDTPLTWTGDDGRKQATLSVQQVFIFGVGFETPRFISWRIQATGEDGETSGFDYVCAWKNLPEFNLSATLSLDGSNVDLEWESLIPCRVKYVANTTGYVSSAEVEANGTFTESAEFTSDTEEDVLTSLSGTAYVTLVPFDRDDKRSGPRYLVPTISN